MHPQNVTRSSSLAHSSLCRDVGLSSSSLRALTTVSSRFRHLCTLLTKSCSGVDSRAPAGFCVARMWNVSGAKRVMFKLSFVPCGWSALCKSASGFPME